MKSKIILFFAVFVFSVTFCHGQDHQSVPSASQKTDSTQQMLGSNLTEDASEMTQGHDNTHQVTPFDPAATAIHHISDANVYTILDIVTIPLPMILYAPERGWDLFSSGRFHSGHHEDGHEAYNGYALHHGSVHKVIDTGFPMNGAANISGFSHKKETVKGKVKDIYYAIHNGKEYRLDARSTLDGGILGGGLTSFYDFSPTKNVVSMILVSLFLFWAFRKVARKYKDNPENAPNGLQGFIEPMFVFVRDEVAIPFIGIKKYMRFLPLLMSIFFFVLGLNLFGQIPFFGGTNVTGNLTVTMIMALIVFVIVNINGKKDYWQHIFWMPNVPVFIKPLLAGVEIMGLFIKPLTLMMRLAGNISAGHIAILSFIGLIFIFGNSGESLGGGVIGTALAVPLTIFMMAIELIVAFVQAYVFTILTASYIGSAIEEHHH
ncbi:MAG: F0F1 ATP synthase subunit A [Saprospiraceae bacterium]|nr:F0F1 ATP synthase subunit A [Saprospiraceae bacterium]